MFRGLKRKIAALAISALMIAVALPTTALANTATSAFTSVSVNQTTINSTQSVVFQISTVNASFVFANVNGSLESATQVSTNNATGVTTWNLTVRPNNTQTVTVYANSTNTQTGAASVAVPITVTGQQQQPTPPQPPTGQGQHRINSIETTAATANNVTLTIVTDAAANYVWISLGPNMYMRARSTSQNANQRTWTASYRPRQAGQHQVTVSANHAWILDGRQASQVHTVTQAAIDTPTPTPSPSPGAPSTAANITRLTANPSTVAPGGRSTITVRASREVTHVWAMVDGNRVNGRREHGGATTTSWSIDVRPDRTQNITVYANTTNTAQGAATDTIRIQVDNVRARIERVTPESIELWAAPGAATTLVVRTCTDTEYVWAIVNGNRENATGGRTVGGQREWEIVVRPEWIQQIRVYAHTRSNNNDGNATTRNVTVVTAN